MKKKDGKKEKTKHIPIGIIIILVLLGMEILGSIQKFFDPVQQIGPFFISNISAVFFILINLIVLFALFYGILRKYKWARTLGVIYYIFWMVLGILNIVFFIINPSIYNPYISSSVSEDISDFSKLVLYSMLIAIIIDEIISLIIIFYLLKRKEYFIK